MLNIRQARCIQMAPFYSDITYSMQYRIHLAKSGSSENTDAAEHVLIDVEFAELEFMFVTKSTGTYDTRPASRNLSLARRQIGNFMGVGAKR